VRLRNTAECVLGRGIPGIDAPVARAALSFRLIILRERIW
jgi:hypothetical protein